MNYHSFFKRDYKSSLDQAPGRDSRHWRLRGLALAAGVVVLGVVLAKNQDSNPPAVVDSTPINVPAIEPAHDTEKPAGGARVQVALALPTLDHEPASVPLAEEIARESTESAISIMEPTPEDTVQWEEIEVRRGDTLSSIFSRLEIHSQLNPILSLADDVALLRSIHPGERIRARKDAGALRELVYEPNRAQRLHIRRADEGYTAELVEREFETRIAQGAGTVRSSLFQAGMDAGMSDSLIMTMANLFGWDIDFALDLREGDHFTVIYQQLYQDGEFVRDGSILAAEFINRGATFQALRYTTPAGDTDYYSPDGRSMRKAFLRTPVEFARISSRFGTRRHPILHTMRQHRGVDYAAATGTPIRASGDGRIVHRGTRGGYGKTIVIQHGQQYRTLYAHMNGYARNTGVGSRVRQGQVIGYVGATGMATGPHLHYEFLVNGVHRDPLKVRLPDADPLPEKYMADFKAKTSPLLSQIETYRGISLAQALQ